MKFTVLYCYSALYINMKGKEILWIVAVIDVIKIYLNTMK